MADSRETTDGSRESASKVLNVSSTVLSLIIALFSVFGLVAGEIRRVFHKPHSDISLIVRDVFPKTYGQYAFDPPDRISIVAINNGDAVGIIGDGSLSIVSRPGDAESLDSCLKSQYRIPDTANEFLQQIKAAKLSWTLTIPLADQKGGDRETVSGHLLPGKSQALHWGLDFPKSSIRLPENAKADTLRGQGIDLGNLLYVALCSSLTGNPDGTACTSGGCEAQLEVIDNFGNRHMQAVPVQCALLARRLKVCSWQK